MSKKAVMISALLVAMMFGLPGAATVEGFICPLLKVAVWDSSLKIDSIELTHGTIDGQKPGAFWLKQSLTYGIDCNVTFRRVNDDKETVYRFQKGICPSGDGEITVEKVKGDFDLEYSIIPESYPDNKTAEVRISGTK